MNAPRLLQALVEKDVRFIVVGGLAAVAQGVPFVTFDVDVVHERSPENVRRLLAVLPHTVESRIEDAVVKLLSLETILEIKRESTRPKDRALVPLLEAVLRRRSP